MEKKLGHNAELYVSEGVYMVAIRSCHFREVGHTGHSPNLRIPAFGFRLRDQCYTEVAYTDNRDAKRIMDVALRLRISKPESRGTPRTYVLACIYDSLNRGVSVPIV